MTWFKLESRSDPQALDDLRPVWQSLSKRVECSYFQTWEWVRAWHDVLEPASRITLVLATDESGGPLGLLALADLRRRLHSRVPVAVAYLGLAGSGRGAGDHLGPLTVSADVAEGLIGEMRDLAGPRPILVESIRRDLAPLFVDKLGGEVIDRIRCPAMVLPADNDVTAMWPKKLRQNVERRGRQLLAEGVRGRWIPPGEEASAMLTDLQDLHTRRWRAKGGSGLFGSERLAFLRRLTTLAPQPDGPWLYVYEHQGSVVGALLGLRHKDTLSIYKTGWDPDYKRFGMGIALAAEAMAWMRTEGLTTFDYLRGSEPHKYEFGAADRTDCTVLRPSGVRGYLLRLRETASIRKAGAESGRGIQETSDALSRELPCPAGGEEG